MSDMEIRHECLKAAAATATCYEVLEQADEFSVYMHGRINVRHRTQPNRHKGEIGAWVCEVHNPALKGWIQPTDPCFAVVWTDTCQRISFYDTKRNVPTTRKEMREKRRYDRRGSLMFSNVDLYFLRWVPQDLRIPPTIHLRR
jgi:hypothetical protein